MNYQKYPRIKTGLIILKFMEYEEICSKILKIDSKIRFVAIYNSWAEKQVSLTQEGSEIHLPEKVTKDAVNQALLRWQSRKKMAEWVGTPKYSMAEYEKIKRMTFYLNDDDILLVTTEVIADHNEIIKQIQNII